MLRNHNRSLIGSHNMQASQLYRMSFNFTLANSFLTESHFAILKTATERREPNDKDEPLKKRSFIAFQMVYKIANGMQQITTMKWTYMTLTS